MFLSVFFCTTVLKIANENQVWEKIIYDKDLISCTGRVFKYFTYIFEMPILRNPCEGLLLSFELLKRYSN